MMAWYDEPGHAPVGDELHRGIGIYLPQDLHDYVHDESVPPDRRAHALLDRIGHTPGWAWSDDPVSAKRYAELNEPPVWHEGESGEVTPVMLHARTPGREHWLSGPHALRARELAGGYDDERPRPDPAQREVQLEAGAPLDVTGISWARPDHVGPWGIHAGEQSPAQDPGWTAHRFPRRIQLTAAVLPAKTAAASRDDLQDKSKVYLRFGHWPENERSFSGAGGYHEDGVSAYELDGDGDPKDPDPDYERGHVHEGCDPDCDMDLDDPDNDTGEEMEGRVRRAQRNRENGSDVRGETGHLVRGDVAGLGYDAEPLLTNVRRVGDWIDHRHLFVPGARPHRLARDPSSGDYEPPAEQPPLRHEGAAFPHSQLKLFHMQPDPGLNVPESGRHNPEDPGAHSRWREETDPDYEAPRCQNCGGNLHDPEGHAEDHQNWLGEQDWHTDWNEEQPGPVLHRGLVMELPPELHNRVHDESVPAADRARALVRHVIRDQGDGSPHGGLGNFWSDDPDVSKSYAEGRGGSRSETPVMLHVKTPPMEHVETDPDQLEHWGVFSYHLNGNREVPLQHQAPLEITGVSWAHPGHAVTRGPSPHDAAAWHEPGPHHFGQDPAWTHHEFGDGIRAHAASEKTWTGDPAPDWERAFREKDPRLTEMHRGIRVYPSDDVYRHVTDTSIPGADRAHVLLRHIGEQMREQPGHGIGISWTDNPDHAMRVARDGGWAEDAARSWRWPHPDDRGDHLGVVLNAKWPEKGHIETDQRVLNRHLVVPYDSPATEGEIPLRKGAPATITGLTWSQPLPGWGHQYAVHSGTFGRPVRYNGTDFEFPGQDRIAAYQGETDPRESEFNGDPQVAGVYWTAPAQQSAVQDGQLDDPQVLAPVLPVPPMLPMTPVATRIYDQKIDDHGDAPDHGTRPRASDPEGYDRDSTEGNGDPKWSDASEQTKRDQNGAAIAMYPEGVSAGGGPGISVGPFTAARLRYSACGTAPEGGEVTAARVPWTDHERTVLKGWQEVPAGQEGDFVSSRDFTGRHPEPPPDNLAMLPPSEAARNEETWPELPGADLVSSPQERSKPYHPETTLENFDHREWINDIDPNAHKSGDKGWFEHTLSSLRAQAAEEGEEEDEPAPRSLREFRVSPRQGHPGQGGTVPKNPQSAITNAVPHDWAAAYGPLTRAKMSALEPTPRAFLLAVAAAASPAAGPDDDDPGEDEEDAEEMPGGFDDRALMPQVLQGQAPPGAFAPPPVAAEGLDPYSQAGMSSQDRLMRQYERDHPGAGELKPFSRDDETERKEDRESVQAHASLRALASLPAFRFEVTASWNDVQAKAQRLRTTGSVRITHATKGMIIGEVRGDHATYESGIQSYPGRPQSVMAWECGCPWASFHQNQPRGSSRFAARMCSHALAIRYEAQSRGMFGRTVAPDTRAPSWQPHDVVVKSWPPYEGDPHAGRWREQLMAPAASRTAAREGGLPFVPSYGQDDLRAHLMHHHGLPASLQNAHMSDAETERWHRGKHRNRTDETHQHERPEGIGAEHEYPAMAEPSEDYGAWNGDREVHPRYFPGMLADEDRSRAFGPLPPSYSSLQRTAAEDEDSQQDVPFGEGVTPGHPFRRGDISNGMYSPHTQLGSPWYLPAGTQERYEEGSSDEHAGQLSALREQREEMREDAEEEERERREHQENGGGFRPRPSLRMSRRVTADQANAPWGAQNVVQHLPQQPYGATSPAEKDQDPGSYGPLSGPDPENWGEIQDGSAVQMPLSSEAVLHYIAAGAAVMDAPVRTRQVSSPKLSDDGGGPPPLEMGSGGGGDGEGRYRYLITRHSPNGFSLINDLPAGHQDQHVSYHHTADEALHMLGHKQRAGSASPHEVYYLPKMDDTAGWKQSDRGMYWEDQGRKPPPRYDWGKKYQEHLNRWFNPRSPSYSPHPDYVPASADMSDAELQDHWKQQHSQTPMPKLRSREQHDHRHDRLTDDVLPESFDSFKNQSNDFRDQKKGVELFGCPANHLEARDSAGCEYGGGGHVHGPSMSDLFGDDSARDQYMDEGEGPGHLSSLHTADATAIMGEPVPGLLTPGKPTAVQEWQESFPYADRAATAGPMTSITPHDGNGLRFEESAEYAHRDPSRLTEEDKDRLSGITDARADRLDPQSDEHEYIWGFRQDRPHEHMRYGQQAAEEHRAAYDAGASARGHDVQWERGHGWGDPASAQSVQGTCRNCGGTMTVGPSSTSSTSHVSRDLRSGQCPGPGTAWQAQMQDELASERFRGAVSQFGHDVKDGLDRQWLRDQGIEASLRAADAMLVLAAEEGFRGTDDHGHEVEYDGIDGWQHLDGSVSHDDGTCVTDGHVREHRASLGEPEQPGGALAELKDEPDAALDPDGLTGAADGTIGGGDAGTDGSAAWGAASSALVSSWGARTYDPSQTPAVGSSAQHPDMATQEPGLGSMDDALSPDDLSIQTVGYQQWSGDQVDSGDLAVSAHPQEFPQEAEADGPGIADGQLHLTGKAASLYDPRQEGKLRGDGDIAAAARQFLASGQLSKTAEVLPAAEAQELIREGTGSRARNLDLLQLDGTHYADAPDDIDDHEDDVLWV
jgi:hypothetical protein